MEFKNLLQELIIEDFKDKSLLQSQLLKWFGETPSEEDKALCEFLLEKFFEIKKNNKLKPVLVNGKTLWPTETKNFLLHFNGEHGTEKFPRDPQLLNKISTYPLKEIKFLVGEFFELPTGETNEGEVDPIYNPLFKINDSSKKDEKVEVSKNLWFSNTSNCIVNEDGFRVYYIPDVRVSKNYGYYEEYLTTHPPYSEQSKRYNQWCVTYESGNMFNGYRNRRTFYFVIDESKSPDVEPVIDGKSEFYVSALQFATDADSTKTNFKITSINNAGDRDITPESLYQLYPKLRGHLDKIVRVEQNHAKENETDAVNGVVDPVNLITESTGPYEYARQPLELKRRYIDSGRHLTKGVSWEHTPVELKRVYTNLTTATNYFERFGSVSLFMEVKKNKTDFDSLENRLDVLGVGIAKFNERIMESSYHAEFTSIGHPHIKLLRSRFGSFYGGLYDFNKGEFVKFHDVTLEGEYNSVKTKTYKTDTESIMVQVYSPRGTSDATKESIISVLPTSMIGQKSVHFISYDKYEELMNSIEEIENDKGKRFPKMGFDAEKDADIEENEY